MSERTRKTSMSSPDRQGGRSLTKRQKNSPSPDLTDILAYLEHKLSRTFPDLSISLHKTSGEKPEIRGYSCENNEKCECFNLVITHADQHILLDRVRYKYGDECALTGTDIMTRLARVFTAMAKKGFPHKVQLYDRARVQMGGKEVLLSLHYIIQHGIPWYAKFGFRTPQYDSEVAANELTMNKPITPMLLKRLNSKLSSESESAQTIQEDAGGLREVPSRNRRFLTKGTTFRQAAKMLFTGGHMDAYLELYDYLTDTKAKRLKYAYYDMWFQGTYGLSVR